MALDDRTIFQSSQPFLYSFVRAAGNGIFAGFHTFHIHAHIAIDAEPVFRAAASDVGRVRASNHRLGRDAACVHTGPAKLVAFDDSDWLARVRKSRRQGRACLARPDDDCVEPLHCSQRAPSMLNLPFFAASSGVFTSWRATM